MTQNVQNKSWKWFMISGWSMTDGQRDRQTDSRQMKLTLRWLKSNSEEKQIARPIVQPQI